MKVGGRASRLLLTTAGLAIGLVMAEGVARLAPEPDDFDARIRAFGAALVVRDAETSHGLRHDAETSVCGIQYRTTSLGTRGAGAVAATDGDTVLVVGDSVTFGWGVRETEAWPAQLQGLLRSGGRTTTVVNGGVPGYGVAETVARLGQLLPLLRPQRVLIGYYPNDPASSDSQTRSPGAAWSALWRRVGPRVRRLQVSSGSAPTAAEAMTHLHEDGSATWRRVTDGFAKAAALCRQAGVSCDVVLLPALYGEPYALADVHTRVAAAAEGAGLGAVDLTPSVAGTDHRSLWVTADDAHPGAEGHRRYAEALARWFLGSQQH